MSFNIDKFARTNKVILIWAAFGALLFLFRDMFGLVFITYVMCFVTHSAVQGFRRFAGVPPRVLVLLLYLLFLLLIGWFLFYLTPKLVSEAKNFTDQLPRAMRTIEAWVEARSADNQYLVPVLEQIKEYLTPEQMVFRGWSMGRGLLERGLQYVSWFFLGLMFSFLIMMDLPHLMRGVRELRFTRLASVYEETAESVVQFARAVGENFRAQLLISAANAMLTAIGLYVLGIDALALLCSLVFLCGLIPVLGVFISSVPIFLMAVNTGGITLGLWAMALIALIHMVEAYFLNPRIVSAVMKINPVMTLIILYIAYSLMGLWGMLLGVPISVYIYRQLIMGSAPGSGGQTGQADAEAAPGADAEPGQRS